MAAGQLFGKLLAADVFGSVVRGLLGHAKLSRADVPVPRGQVFLQSHQWDLSP